jgi:hypothetical protein
LRRQYFLHRAALELPDVATDAVLKNEAFRAAIKIERDGGSHRSWALLKTKISKDWEDNYDERHKQVARSQDAIANGHMALWEALAMIADWGHVESKIPVAEQYSVEKDIPTVEEGPTEEEQVEEEEEEEDEMEPYSIWNDRDLACEYQQDSRRLAEKGTIKDSSNDSVKAATVGFDDSTASIL